jgi:hypothetical protein
VHVAHVLAKLGVHTRAQVAAWAVGQGLAPNDPGEADDQPIAAAGDKYIVR